MLFIDRATRHLFFTGKGGVGKTSLACATVIALADQGKRVLLVSTDPASNLLHARKRQQFWCLHEVVNEYADAAAIVPWTIDESVGAEALRQIVNDACVRGNEPTSKGA